VRIEEGDVLGNSAAEDWQRRPSFTHQIPEIPYVNNQELRRPWTNGNYDPFIIDERQDQRGPPEFDMQRFQHPAHHQGRRYYQDDIVARGEQEADDQLAIITRLVKIDFPKFDGYDPSWWIYRANKFFYYHRTPYNQKLVLASVHMEGKALVWYQDMNMFGFCPIGMY
jgi:hypothetical protein